MKNNIVFARELLEKYPDLREMKPPYRLDLCGKLIIVAYYSTAAGSINELRLGHLCKRLDAFSTDFKDNTYGIYIKDRLDKRFELKCVVHEIGHIINGHFEKTEIGEKEEADAREFEACYQGLLRVKEEQIKQRIKNKKNCISVIIGLIVIVISNALILYGSKPNNGIGYCISGRV